MSRSNHINEDLLVKFLLGEAAPDEERMVEAWLQESGKNRARLEELKFLLKKSVPRTIPATDEDAAWLRFRQKISQSKAEAPVRKMNRLKTVSIAAIFLLVAAAGWLLFGNGSGKEEKIHTVSATRQILVDTLSDGSVITLNKGAEIRFPETFSGNERVVALKGEAFFNITPDRSKPFVIRVKELTIKVVGTSFNVKQGTDGVEVIVENRDR